MELIRAIYHLTTVVAFQSSRSVHSQTIQPSPFPSQDTCSSEELVPSSSAFTQSSDYLSDACTSKWMAQRDCSAAYIQFVPIDLEFVSAIDCHGGEGFIDLDQINIFEREIILPKQFRDRDDRVNTHDPRCKSSNSGTNILCRNGCFSSRAVDRFIRSMGPAPSVI